jgi:hypothetical protein
MLLVVHERLGDLAERPRPRIGMPAARGGLGHRQQCLRLQDQDRLCQIHPSASYGNFGLTEGYHEFWYLGPVRSGELGEGTARPVMTVFGQDGVDPVAQQGPQPDQHHPVAQLRPQLTHRRWCRTRSFGGRVYQSDLTGSLLLLARLERVEA